MILMRILPLIPIVLAMLGIGASIAISPWFNIVENALSDLGHATKSAAAPIYNGALVLAGLFAFALGYSAQYVERKYNIMLIFSATMLTFIGTFDEIYRGLHSVVSVLFFVGIAAFVLLIVLDAKVKAMYRVFGALLLALNIFLWISHMYYRTPRGAAIPELVSAISFLPFYLLKYYGK